MLVLFSLAGFLEVASYGQLSAFTPLYLPTIGIAAADVAFWVGAITALANFVGVPFLPFWGALADRYGRKPLIIRSFIAAFFALGITAVAPNLAVFTLARGFQALALGNTGLILATLADHVPASRVAFAFGVVNGANPFGAFVGPLVGGPVVDHFGFPWLVAIDAVLMALVVMLLTFGYRDGFVPLKTGEPLLRMAADGVAMVIRSPRLRALFPALFLLFGGWILAFIYVPLVVARLYGGADLATVVGLVLGGGGLITIGASPGIGALADRLGHWRVLIGGGALLVVVWLLPFFTRDLVTFAVLWAVANGLSSGVFSVSFNVIASSAGERSRGRVMTFAYAPANLSFVVGPLIGSVLAPIDVFLVFPAAAVLTAVGLAATAYARGRPAP
jgi:DHA1 family multidrug resistance protein-like MFS transporter